MRKTALSANQTVQITTTTELQPHMSLAAEVFRGNGNVLVTHIGEKEYVINLGSRLSLSASFNIHKHQQYHQPSTYYCMITVSLFIPLSCRFCFRVFRSSLFRLRGGTATIRACSTLSSTSIASPECLFLARVFLFCVLASRPFASRSRATPNALCPYSAKLSSDTSSLRLLLVFYKFFRFSPSQRILTILNGSVSDFSFL
jgi:hypothetical protein